MRYKVVQELVNFYIPLSSLLSLGEHSLGTFVVAGSHRSVSSVPPWFLKKYNVKTQTKLPHKKIIKENKANQI
jgi:hypothetical protein